SRTDTFLAGGQPVRGGREHRYHQREQRFWAGTASQRASHSSCRCSRAGVFYRTVGRRVCLTRTRVNRSLGRFVMVRRLLVLAWALALLPQAAAGQARVTGADIVGTVRDASGAGLPAPEVTVVNRAAKVTRTVVTDGRGRYLVAALPPGTYRLKADAHGFASETREGLVLVLGQSAEADVTLKLASQAESIAVSPKLRSS